MKKCLALCLLLPLLTAAASAAGEVTRGGFVAGLWALWGAVPYEDTRAFSDVSHDREDTAAICWAHDMGLIKGTGAGRFEPDRPITREEAALLLRRAAERLGRNTAIPLGLAACNDGEGTSPWAGDALYWATDTGLLPFTPDGLLAPAGPISPEELEEIWRRFE